MNFFYAILYNVVIYWTIAICLQENNVRNLNINEENIKDIKKIVYENKKAEKNEEAKSK